MPETFMTNQLVMKSESIMKLEKLQQDKEMIIQLVADYIINTSKIVTN